MPVLYSDRMLVPGAAMSTVGPQLEKDALVPDPLLAPTAITPSQLAGEKVSAFASSFPAAATTTTPAAMASSTACCVGASHDPLFPPRLRLMTRAGFGFTAGEGAAPNQP